MSELRRITPPELRLLIRGAKARHSGTILIETPAAQALLAPQSPRTSGAVAVSDPPLDGALYWLQAADADALPRFVDALARDHVSDAAGLADEVRVWQVSDPAPRFRDGRTAAMLDRLAGILEAASRRSLLVMEIPDASALDPHRLHLFRTVLDRADRIRAVFLVHFSAPPVFASPQAATRWGRAVAGLLDLCVKSRMWNRANIVLDDLMGRFEDLPDDALRGHVLFRAGMAAVRQGRSDDAEAFYVRALEHLARAGDHETLVKTLNNLGILRLEDRRLEAAEECFARALKLGEELQSDYHLAVTYGNYARLWLVRDRPEHATAQLQKSLIFTARSGYYHHGHTTYATLGDVLARSGDGEGAVEMMKRAILICERQSNLIDLAGCQVRLGRCLGDLGRLEEAERAFTIADGLYAKLGSRFGRMTLNENLAVFRLAQGDIEAARACWSAAEEVARELRNRSALARLEEFAVRLRAAGATSPVAANQGDHGG